MRRFNPILGNVHSNTAIYKENRKQTLTRIDHQQ